MTDQDDSETAKAVAVIEHASTLSARDKIIEEHSASYRWLMASLLAINGGGLLALKDTTSAASFWAMIAVICFYIGMAASLLIAWLGQRASRAMLDPLAELLAFWTVVSVSGSYDEEQHHAIIGKVQHSMGASRRPQIAGWLAFIFFSFGLACVTGDRWLSVANGVHSVQHPSK